MYPNVPYYIYVPGAQPVPPAAPMPPPAVPRPPPQALPPPSTHILKEPIKPPPQPTQPSTSSPYVRLPRRYPEPPTYATTHRYSAPHHPAAASQPSSAPQTKVAGSPVPSYSTTSSSSAVSSRKGKEKEGAIVKPGIMPQPEQQPLYYPYPVPYYYPQHIPLATPPPPLVQPIVAPKPAAPKPDSGLSAAHYHTCSRCGRIRSRRFHHDHPILPDSKPIGGLCRKCLQGKSSSDSDKTRRKHRSSKGIVEEETLAIYVADGPDGRRRNEQIEITRHGRSSSRNQRHGLIDRLRSGSHTRDDRWTIKVKGDEEPKKPSWSHEDIYKRTVVREVSERDSHHRDIPYRSMPASSRSHSVDRVHIRETDRDRKRHEAEERIASHPQPFSHGHMVRVEDHSRPSVAHQGLGRSPPRHGERIVREKIVIERSPERPRRARSPSVERGRTQRRSPLRGILRSPSRSRLRAPSMDRHDRRSEESTKVHTGHHRVEFGPNLEVARRKDAHSDNIVERHRTSRVRQRMRIGELDGHHSNHVEDHDPSHPKHRSREMHRRDQLDRGSHRGHSGARSRSGSASRGRSSAPSIHYRQVSAGHTREPSIHGKRVSDVPDWARTSDVSADISDDEPKRYVDVREIKEVGPNGKEETYLEVEETVVLPPERPPKVKEKNGGDRLDDHADEW